MFALNFVSDFHALVGSEQWALIACASFEERCLAVPEAVAGSLKRPPRHATILCPRDKGSQWEGECRTRQDHHNRRLAHCFPSKASEFSLSDPDLDDLCQGELQDILELMRRGSIDLLVIDISAMPKACFFPLVRHALSKPRPRVLVTYSEPARYAADLLHSDPMQPPASLAGLNRLLPGADSALAWIPILGFGSFFAEHIYEAITATGQLEHRIYPLVGFPGFDPSLYDRMLLDNGDSLLTMLRTRPSIRDQFLFAPASDPFQTKDRILDAMKTLPAEVAWIGSPLGPRPMALGMLLAALDSELSILVCRAQSYNPNYSTGIGKIHLYPVRL